MTVLHWPKLFDGWVWTHPLVTNRPDRPNDYGYGWGNGHDNPYSTGNGIGEPIEGEDEC